ncbi:hypothetical protein IE4771_PB00076 (plasmid) [Rhizobium etli bv. mimosae str. IE4771]|uniref:Uncharacterized protein n=1 Tax=Rhizobium etli bv. mimosae str. IE4771 TaxID=1432050 RepID=A0A060ICL4_RHIET|nr:hypothetical protein IE4771_PB00076 [Rhizobium sp. IE4771]
MQFAPINWRNQVQNSRSENRWPRPAQLPFSIAAAEWPEPALCADCMGLFQHAGHNPAMVNPEQVVAARDFGNSTDTHVCAAEG